MAVPISNVTRRQVYAPSGTGGAGPYAFTFEILSNTDIAVFKDDTLLTLTTHYTVTINANGTGSVTITATGLALAPTSPTQYAIVGNRTISRTTDFTTGGDFFANTLNDELDQQTIFAQQNAEGLQRALVAPQTDPTSINMVMPRASLRANKILAFDANGNPVIGDTVGTNRGNWAAGTLYYIRDIVKDTSNSNIYQVITQHTSSGSQPISSNVDVANWALLVDAAAAAASASAAASSASAASTSATNASTSASSASTSATNAASSASAASTSATNAAASYDSFDDRYLGPKASPPTLDNDGNALLTGALYFDTALNLLQVYSGAAWASIVSGPASSTDNAIARFDGTTGKVVQNSVVTIADTTGNMTGVGAMGIGTPTISSGYSLDVQNGLVLARMESTTGANAALFVIKNTAGNTIFGNQGSTASTFTGAYNYATVLGTDSAQALQFATNNTVRFEVNSAGAFYNYGSMTIATTLGVTGATTLSSTLTYGGVTLTNAVTGTGKMVLDTSPTFTTSVIGGATMAVFNTTSTTVNAFGAATALNLGAATGTLTVANTTLAAKRITASTTLAVTGVSTLTGGAVIQGMTVGLGSGSGATNTAVGASALLFNINGIFNSALGYEALRYNTTGSSNTATGNYALYSNSSGAGNTASGSTALEYNTLGDNNVATGANALQYNTSGSFNTAAGYEALRNTTGSRSTAIGWQALVSYTPPVVTAGAFVIATSYTIVTVGTTNFVAIGASANTVGVVFTATGAGSGTGTASTNVDATNTAIGYGAGSVITTGTKNTIIGAYSGNQGSLDIRTASNYVVLSDGDGNPRAYWNGANATFGGNLAVTGGATIQGLTVGLGAGAVSTNTIVGNGALSTNSTGANLTAIGYQALFNSTGTRNSALGYRAGFNVNSGEYNTFIGGPEGSFGYSTGYSTTTGSFNTALGGGALANNLGASGNTACGYQSLLLNVAGAANVAIGQGALRATTSGNSAAVGYQAGLLATGIGNQFFGYSSGSAVTTGAKNVILGSYTGSAAPISATGSNYIVLSDGDGNVRQVIDSSGNVGIGITPASPAKLEIKQALASQQGAWVYASANDSHARLFCDGTSVGLAASFTSTGSYLPMTFYTSATERMRISAAGIVTMSAYGVGTATFSATGVISSVSDETWKIKDGVPVDTDAMLKKLEPGYWYYNDEKKETFGTDRQLGFYAQNVNAAIGPEAAPTPEEGKPWGYYDRSVLAVTVMSLQKALATIESLTARITALETA